MFFQWWQRNNESIDGLLRAGIAHLWFVAIHPFEDGNGRIARTLTEMAQAQAEKLATRYYTLSSQIMARRESYYAILEHANRGNGDITEWMVWFLGCLSAAILNTNDLLSNVMVKSRFWKRYAQTEFK